MLWMAFVLQVLPLALLALASTALGLALISPWISTAMQLPLGIVALLLFIALLTFREAKGWNLALLLGLALVAGAFVGSVLPPEARSKWGVPLGISLAALVVSGFLGRALGRRLRKAGIGLWLLSWIYLLGWVFLALRRAPEGFSTSWAAVGVVIFVGMSTNWFASLGEGIERASTTSLAADLYILGFNLMLAFWVITGWFSKS